MRVSTQLRKMFGTYDPFNLKRIRRQKRLVPEWAQSNSRVQSILLASFPKLTTNTTQRLRAGKWMRVIYLYFQCGYSYSEVASEMGKSPGSILSMTRAITRAANGRRASGSGYRGGKRGRPRRNNSAITHTNMGRTDKDLQQNSQKGV